MDQNLINKIKKIKMVATDIDGVWTDGTMHYKETGEYIKSFSTYDGMAVELLKNENLIIVILTGEKSKHVLARAKKLNIKEVYINEREKQKRLNYLLHKYNLSLNEVAYIGDDINDLEVLSTVGFSCMVPNSPILNQFKPDYITKTSGGRGAFREFADLILKYK
tara:strand:+ start:454 stop:945 length:492 start_codon:yes stop_codon:yes gene_type:complete